MHKPPSRHRIWDTVEQKSDSEELVDDVKTGDGSGRETVPKWPASQSYGPTAATQANGPLQPDEHTVEIQSEAMIASSAAMSTTVMTRFPVASILSSNMVARIHFRIEIL